MGLLNQINHLLNFFLPAVGLAAFFLLAGLLRHRKKPLALSRWLQFGINSAVGALALGLGLWGFGVDGKMATYAGVVVAMATSQWAMETLRGRG